MPCSTYSPEIGGGAPDGCDGLDGCGTGAGGLAVVFLRWAQPATAASATAKATIRNAREVPTAPLCKTWGRANCRRSAPGRRKELTPHPASLELPHFRYYKNASAFSQRTSIFAKDFNCRSRQDCAGNSTDFVNDSPVFSVEPANRTRGRGFAPRAARWLVRPPRDAISAEQA